MFCAVGCFRSCLYCSMIIGDKHCGTLNYFFFRFDFISKVIFEYRIMLTKSSATERKRSHFCRWSERTTHKRNVIGTFT